MYIYCFGGGVERKIGALVRRKHEGDMDSPHGTALGATIALVLWIVVVICAGVDVARDQQLSDRETSWWTMIVVAIPLIGVLLWVTLSPERAWRCFMPTRPNPRPRR